MTVKELKNHLVPYINIPAEFIILNRYKSENKSEELALPSSSLEDLNYSDTIQISVGVALRDGQYRGVIFWPEPLDQTQVILPSIISYTVWLLKTIIKHFVFCLS